MTSKSLSVSNGSLSGQRSASASAICSTLHLSDELEAVRLLAPELEEE
ncbi:MAG: hypothetical protein ACHBNF_08825 [Chromatiales bacterium]